MSIGKRRSNGEGSVYCRTHPDGRKQWIAQLSVGPRTNRVKYRRSAMTKPLAQAALRELVAARLVAVPDVPAPPMMPRAEVGVASVSVPSAIGSRIKKAAIAQGWSVRSIPEARVAYWLARFGLGPDQVQTQAKVGRFRPDFVVPDVLVAIEVDGPMHRLPEMAIKDLERDLILHDAGWEVFRVDAYTDEDKLQARLARIVRFVKSERLR